MTSRVRQRLGFSYNSMQQRYHHDGPPGLEKFGSAAAALEYCVAVGAGGYQGGLSGWDAEQIRKVRALVDGQGVYFEGQIGLPDTDVDRFASELRTLTAAGGNTARVVLHGGRRYEVFDSASAFADWKAAAWKKLTIAEPIARKLRVKLAIENHKDLRVDELLDVVKRISSPWIGACVDFGNSLALLEDPSAVVAALAPFAFSTHVKDIAVAPTETGFLMSEVPLGEGMLDVARMIELLRAKNPHVRFSLEMITRDPLVIPCLTDRYFATMKPVRDADLARTLATVKARAWSKPLPRTSGLSQAEKVSTEDSNNRKCLAYARAHLGL